MTGVAPSGVAPGLPPAELPAELPPLEVLDEIQRRVLWLSTRMIDAANRERETGDGIKVGGHQASSASLVTVMTALWFAHLDRYDRVAVKPHASPVFHAIQYLLGNLDRDYLTRLRSLGGLQSYPSRTKDPDRDYVDFSTGSVGLGAAAPLFAGAVRRYVDAHFGERPASRYVALIGDAELDEGNVWEAVADPTTVGLGPVTWIVDFNRQSLDRVVPGSRIAQYTAQFAASGWHVVEVKYGSRLRAAFAEPHGDALRRWIDHMPNEQYQSLFGRTGEDLRKHFLHGAPAEVEQAISGVGDGELPALIGDLGGHDLASLLEALAECDRVTDRPSVVFAYTVKGWGLPIAGDPRNHSALLTGAQIDVLRERSGLTGDSEWDRFADGTPAARWCRTRGAALARTGAVPVPAVPVPAQALGSVGTRPLSTQEAFGRVLVGLSRQDGTAPYLVTTAPDVAVSTNLAGFINRMGVFSPVRQPHYDPADSLLKWVQSPDGNHIELGISEMNLFILLGQLGLAHDLSGQRLLPVGTVYDPFVCRGLDALIHAVYSGALFVVAGTPSGVTLAPEGGAHQSVITPSIGLELPDLTFCEPAYGRALDWLLCDSLARIGRGERGSAAYLRLSTRPLDQAPFTAAVERYGEDRLRARVLAGGYRLHVSDLGPAAPVVHLAASGAVMPEVLAASRQLEEEGIAAHVVDVTSLDRLFTDWRGRLRQDYRTASGPRRPHLVGSLFPGRAPVVTVHDASSHTMAWLGSALGVHTVPVGVDGFGESGSVSELYAKHDLSSAHVVNAALAALAL